MKKYVILIGMAALMMNSCNEDIYDNIKEYADSETVYPAGYVQDSVSYKAGFERVEIYLTGLDEELYLPKAKKTVVEYNGKDTVFTPARTFVNVTGLKIAQTYQFKIFTEDEFGNRSTPVEISGKPFTEEDVNSIVVLTSAAGFVSHGIIKCQEAAGIYTVCGADYSYTDENSVVRSEQSNSASFVVEDLPEGQINPVNVNFHILPTNAIDTLVISSSVEVTTMLQATFNAYINETSPFNGAAPIVSFATACTIPAADFDLGGSEIAFHKASLGGTAFPTYRTDGTYGLDMVGGLMGFGWTTAGDWFHYTVYVQDPGEYKISYFVSTPYAGCQTTITIDEFDYFGISNVPNTGGWANGRWFDMPESVFLSAGLHKLKWTLANSGFNFYGLQIASVP
ncbi:beta-glucanase [Candidatus Symbiothrix dinenymphae]|nr:beta-glucanase [Candidatus Symbiothrix dinenymphae]